MRAQDHSATWQRYFANGQVAKHCGFATALGRHDATGEAYDGSQWQGASSGAWEGVVGKDFDGMDRGPVWGLDLKLDAQLVGFGPRGAADADALGSLPGKQAQHRPIGHDDIAQGAAAGRQGSRNLIADASAQRRA